MSVLTGTLFLRVACVLLLLVFIHTVAALGTAMIYGIFSPDEEYENYTIDYYVERSVLTITASVAAISAMWIVFLFGDVSRFKDMWTRFCGRDGNKAAPTRKDAIFAILIVFTIAIITTTYMSFIWWGYLKISHVVIWVSIPCMIILGLVWLARIRICSR